MTPDTRASDTLVESVVREVIAQLQGSVAVSGGGRHGTGQAGMFRNVDDAVAAAGEAYRELNKRALADRGRAIAQIRRIVIDQAEELGRAELEETRIGRLDHKIEKLRVVGTRIPGVEFLRSEASSGDNGLTITEFGPFGTIGVVTPVTHSLPTLAANAIMLIAFAANVGSE